MKTIVLLVDDDPNILTLLEYTFRQQGYETVSAENGAVALELLDATNPDLIVTDVMMPVVDGYELCQRVRSDHRWRTLPFIFLSARGSTDDRVAGLDLGADDYVVKPFDRRELLAKARTLLNRVRIYREQIVHGTTSPAARETDRGVSPEEGNAERTAHVLVVDDEEPMRRLMEFNLKKARFNVSLATNGQEALEAVAKAPLDLIISDVMMPVMDGLQLRKALLQREPYSSIPFLFLTAKGQPHDMMAGLVLGVDDYLTKPVNPQVLVQKARNLVERNRASAQRYRREIQQAAERVTLQLEPEAPRVPGMVFAQRCEPLEVRGGDYYDYVKLDSALVAFVVGDVMGKKWGAWFFSVAYVAYLRSVIRSASDRVTSPGAIVGQINRLLWEDLKVSEVFTTLIFGIADAANRRVTYANAGHLPPIRYTASSGAVSSGGQGGLILGVQPDEEYGEESVVLAPGDALVFVTDGITEARNRSDELFGDERLREAVRGAGRAPAQEIVGAVFEAAARFVGEMPYEDDRTVLVVQSQA
jgi:sigma-B regulation protein RsbU (phosphoserine phosphatase)